MAAIVVRTYGGMQPSANPFYIPESASVLARNLELRFGDFRPLPVPLDQGVTMQPGQTLYRFHGSPAFITNAGQVSYVRGPIPNDPFERTYYTGDGAPKVITSGGEVRQLGVPAPATAPGVAVNVTAQYSTDDAASDQAKKLQEMVDAARAGYEWPFDGLTDDDLVRFVPNGDPTAKWSFSFKMPGTMQAGIFVPDNPSHANLMDDSMGFHLGTLSDGKVYGFSDIDFRSQRIVLRDDFSSRLATLTDPVDSSKPLLQADQIATIKSTLQDALTPADANFAAGVTRLRNLRDQFVGLADTGSAAALANVGAVKAFYQRAEVVAEINSAIGQAVSSIYGAMFTYNNANYSIPITGGGGGGGGNDSPTDPFHQQPA